MNPIKISAPTNESKEERAFEKLVMWTSSFSIGVLAAFLASLKQVNPTIVFKFTFETVAAFVGGAALTALFLRIVLHGSKKRRAPLVFAAAIVSVLLYFCFGIENSARANRSDMMIGTAFAVAVLSFVAWVIWRLGKYFESDGQRDRDSER
jgi:multisubunit Na+/H+ antiporter MnhB subunit